VGMAVGGAHHEIFKGVAGIKIEGAAGIL
jgi:hypothetical protein